MGAWIVFTQCGFLNGRDNLVVLVVPEVMPQGDTLRISVSPTCLSFCDEEKEYGRIDYEDGELYKRLSRYPQIGLVEYTGEGDFPDVITNMAYVEVLSE